MTAGHAHEELEPEVNTWFDTLDREGQETAAFHADLPAERGVLLDAPYTRQRRYGRAANSSG